MLIYSTHQKKQKQNEWEKNWCAQIGIPGLILKQIPSINFHQPKVKKQNKKKFVVSLDAKY